MSYRVKTVVAMTGIPRPTLVAWERRYGLLTAQRDDSGYRVYSDADVALLRELKGMVDRGFAISEALRVAGVGRPGARPQLLHTPAPSSAWGPLLKALLAFDRAAADAEARVLDRLSFDRALDEVLVPMLRELGDAWEAGTVSVAQEHFTSAFVHERMAGMFHSLASGPEHGVPVACTTFPAESHELGMLAVAIRLALRGCRVLWLAADLPVDEIVGFARSRPVRILCLSLIRTRPEEEVLRVAHAVREGVPRDTIVAIGGAGVRGLLDRSTAGLWYCSDLDDLWRRWAVARGEPASVAG